MKLVLSFLCWFYLTIKIIYIIYIYIYITLLYIYLHLLTYISHFLLLLLKLLKREISYALWQQAKVIIYQLPTALHVFVRETVCYRNSCYYIDINMCMCNCNIKYTFCWAILEQSEIFEILQLLNVF